MINQYNITSLINIGLPSLEVTGEVFHAKNMYEFVGKEQYSTTFIFKNGSAPYLDYGSDVTGYAYYDPKEKALLESNSNLVEIQFINQLKIDVVLDGLSVNQKHQLKYIGVQIANLDSICYLKYKENIEVPPTGEKKDTKYYWNTGRFE